MLLNEMETLYWVIECQSFSQAAEKLGISKSSVSKQITRLEQHLKTKLIIRSTRQLTLTEMGQRYYKHCEAIVLEAQAAHAGLSAEQDIPHGTLRISLPPAIGVHLLAPFFSQFLKKYPKLTLDINLENKLSHIIRDNYDLIIRSKSKLDDSNLIAQPLFVLRSVICATENYYKQHGMPQAPKDLKHHNVGYYNASSTSQQLHFKGQTVLVTGNIASNHLDIIKQAVLGDLCIAVLPDYMLKEELRHGKVISCLDNTPLLSHDIQLIYPERKLMPLKLKTFIQELKAFITN